MLSCETKSGASLERGTQQPGENLSCPNSCLILLGFESGKGKPYEIQNQKNYLAPLFGGRLVLDQPPAGIGLL